MGATVVFSLPGQLSRPFRDAVASGRACGPPHLFRWVQDYAVTLERRL